jgi:hypothetical protein
MKIVRNSMYFIKDITDMSEFKNERLCSKTVSLVQKIRIELAHVLMGSS